MNKIKDFSIREEVKVALEENNLIKYINVQDILNEVESDEMMLSIISLTIYEAILNKLKENNISEDNIIQKISSEKRSLVCGLLGRNII